MSDVYRAIEETGVIAIVRLDDLTSAGHVVQALVDAGIACIEFTLTNRMAIATLEESRRATSSDVFLGAGTVLDPESARTAILGGAQFIVTPTLRAETIALCRRYRIPCMIGAFTPTEILTAWELGADYVKVFPASAGGPRFLREVRGPLPQVRLVPTGGVSIENAGDLVRAGAVALGVGSNIVSNAAVAKGDWGGIAERARAFLAAVQTARSS